MNNDYFDGEHFEGFGNKWDALFTDFEDFFCNQFAKIIQNGKPYLSHKKDNMKFFGLTDKKNKPITITTLIEVKKDANEVVSFFPMMKGITNKVILKDKHTWDSQIEGEFAGEIQTENIGTLNFFDGHYGIDIEKFEKDKKVNISFSALAFLLDKFEEKEFQIDKGAFYDFQLSKFLEKNKDKTEADFEAPIIKLSGETFRMFMPTKYACEYEAVGQIEEISYTTFYDEEITILKVNFGRKENNDNFYCNLYASQKVLQEYKPQVDDAISTVFWLTGQFEE